jgi:hypothetical protein
MLGGSSSSELQYIFEIPDNPFAVTTTLDSGNQVELLFTPEGGSLSATASDGTVFTLDVPAGALVADTLIRMIPVRSVEGMPFGGESYAVQFEPEGLQFFDYATLTIDPVEDIPVDQQIFFGYEGSGENLALALPVVDSREMKILLDHFSGYGVNKGLLADVEPVRQRIGGSAEARLQSAIAEKLHAERQNQLQGQESESLDLTEFFNEFEKQVVKPRLAAAGESCAAGRLAIQTVMGFERQRQLLGMGEEGTFPSELLNTVAEVCMKEEYEICRDDHIIHHIVPAWLGIERQFQLLGMGDSGILDQAKEYVKKCLTFELRFESQGTLNADDGGGVDSSVQSKVKLQFNKGSWLVEGQAPLENTAFEFKVPKCQVTSNRGGGTFKVISLAPIADKTATADVLGTVEDIKLVYDPGETSESYTVNCKNRPSFSAAQPYWSSFFIALHESELDLANGGFLMEDWEILGNEYYAKKEWIKDGSDMGVIEAGTFKLYHKPEK